MTLRRSGARSEMRGIKSRRVAGCVFFFQVPAYDLKFSGLYGALHHPSFHHPLITADSINQL